MAQLRYQSRKFWGGLVGVALVVGGFGCQPQQTSTETSPSPTSSPSPEQTDPQPPATKPELAVYWIAYKDQEQLALEPTKLPLDNLENASSEEKLMAAFKRLLEGPANADKTNAIPEKTQLNSLKVQEDGVRIDLSREFTTGGGTKSMQARLGQIVYTASSLDPQEAVWISVDGEPLEVLSGEGLIVSQPMTRKEFEKNFSL
ncbi:GerMN domain-containing protein [Acaryochloris sp. IP29b_bin.148]|uniref:GerMN domain-containing protein n=1 Tax=Acaryochloris sp. IP29b_bin.148 TaxID=2969218 RepID=UPI00260EF1E5|nr:GerMN domain-containing protein [Acaryochloris sp. IP29b_bin.148]